VDPVLLPRLVRYKRSLPREWLSHPQCECKASLYREALANLPKPIDPAMLASLDGLLIEYIREPVPTSMMIPEVINTAIYLAIADTVFRNDEAFLDWISGFSRRALESPMYRILMAMVSPERLAGGGARRWNNFHTGVEYAITINDGGTDSVMRYPTNLFDRLAFRGHLRAIEAAYRASGAPNATAELGSMTSTEVRFRVTWYPERAPRQL
jgi:hypothetical protein